jgi:hypothetical protein
MIGLISWHLSSMIKPGPIFVPDERVGQPLFGCAMLEED